MHERKGLHVRSQPRERRRLEGNPFIILKIFTPDDGPSGVFKESLIWGSECDDIQDFPERIRRKARPRRAFLKIATGFNP